MNGLPNNAPLTTIAKESLAMSKESGDKTFKIVAMVMMAASGLATLLHAGHVIFRDMKGKREQAPASRPAVPKRPEPEDEPHGESDDPDRSWVAKARVGGRADGQEKRWAEHRGHRAPARQH